MKKDNLKGQHRINEQIRAKEVRIVGDNIEPTVVSIQEALRLAEENEADLVEISPNAVPPVCKIIDYSKFLYQLKKKQKELKAKQVKVEVKEIRFGPQTDDHDYNFKLKHAMEFLKDGDKVRLTCSSRDVQSSSKNKARFFCCVSLTTSRSMVRLTRCPCSKVSA